MKHFLMIAALFLCFPKAHAAGPDVIKIEVGSGHSYESYSNDELRRRVFQLERAVQQLQMRVFDLEYAKPSQPETNDWTCRMSSFGKTFVSTAKTKAKAMANVIEKCSSATNAVHCSESDVSCGNE